MGGRCAKAIIQSASNARLHRGTSSIYADIRLLLVSTFVGDGELLDMSPHVIGGQSAAELQYDLRAVSHHSGFMGGGHYTAHACNSGDSSWYNFDDTHTARATASMAKSQSSYVLFYARKGVPAAAVERAQAGVSEGISSGGGGGGGGSCDRGAAAEPDPPAGGGGGGSGAAPAARVPIVIPTVPDVVAAGERNASVNQESEGADDSGNREGGGGGGGGSGGGGGGGGGSIPPSSDRLSPEPVSEMEESARADECKKNQD